MLKQKLKTKRIILASKSPRRQELLKSLQIPFDIITSSVEEIYPESLKKHEITDYLSKLKAGAFKNKLKNNDILITSDTIVWHNNSMGEENYRFHDHEKLAHYAVKIMVDEKNYDATHTTPNPILINYYLDEMNCSMFHNFYNHYRVLFQKSI